MTRTRFFFYGLLWFCILGPFSASMLMGVIAVYKAQDPIGLVIMPIVTLLLTFPLGIFLAALFGSMSMIALLVASQVWKGLPTSSLTNRLVVSNLLGAFIYIACGARMFGVKELLERRSADGFIFIGAPTLICITIVSIFMWPKLLNQKNSN